VYSFARVTLVGPSKNHAMTFIYPATTCRDLASRPDSYTTLLDATHSGRSVVLVERGFQAIGPVAVSASRHAKLSGQLARETVTRNG